MEFRKFLDGIVEEARRIAEKYGVDVNDVLLCFAVVMRTVIEIEIEVEVEDGEVP